MECARDVHTDHPIEAKLQCLRFLLYEAQEAVIALINCPC